MTCLYWIRSGVTEHHWSDSATVKGPLQMVAYRGPDIPPPPDPWHQVLSCEMSLGCGRAKRSWDKQHGSNASEAESTPPPNPWEWEMIVHTSSSCSWCSANCTVSCSACCTSPSSPAALRPDSSSWSSLRRNSSDACSIADSNNCGKSHWTSSSIGNTCFCNMVSYRVQSNSTGLAVRVFVLY